MIKTIRVLHTEWSDGWGGQEIRIIHEMKMMRLEGAEVYLACRENSMIKDEAITNNIKVEYYKALPDNIESFEGFFIDSIQIEHFCL